MPGPPKATLTPVPLATMCVVAADADVGRLRERRDAGRAEERLAVVAEDGVVARADRPDLIVAAAAEGDVHAGALRRR